MLGPEGTMIIESDLLHSGVYTILPSDSCSQWNGNGVFIVWNKQTKIFSVPQSIILSYRRCHIECRIYWSGEKAELKEYGTMHEMTKWRHPELWNVMLFLSDLCYPFMDVESWALNGADWKFSDRTFFSPRIVIRQKQMSCGNVTFK